MRPTTRRSSAKRVTELVGDDVDGIELNGYEPVREEDTWWRGPESLVALYSGEAASMPFPGGRIALIYCGLDDWGLGGGVDDDG
ncbi:hypothetical protein [Streptomyces sp. NPDC054783]